MSSSIPQTSGIYQILCVPTGKVYVGSAVNLRKRWQEHLRDLRGQRHHSRHLQRAWDKYGESSFVFSVVEAVAVPSLMEREQHWLDHLRSYERDYGYNLSRQAGTTLGVQYTDETRRKMGESHAGKSHSAARVENQALAQRREFVVISPDKEVRRIFGLAQFCRMLGFHHKPLSEVALGQRKSYKGWACFRADDPDLDNKIAAALCYAPQATEKKWYTIVSPEGETYHVLGLRQFCREMGLRDTNMLGVASGRRKHTKGWTCTRMDDG